MAYERSNSTHKGAKRRFKITTLGIMHTKGMKSHRRKKAPRVKRQFDQDGHERNHDQACETVASKQVRLVSTELFCGPYLGRLRER